MATHRYKSVFFRSEVSKKNFGRIVLGASLLLGAVRARHDEPSARSPSFAQLELPGLEARRNGGQAGLERATKRAVPADRRVAVLPVRPVPWGSLRVYSLSGRLVVHAPRRESDREAAEGAQGRKS